MLRARCLVVIFSAISIVTFYKGSFTLALFIANIPAKMPAKETVAMLHSDSLADATVIGLVLFLLS